MNRHWRTISSWKARAGPCRSSWRYPSTHQNNLFPHVRWRPDEAGQEPEIGQHLTASPPIQPVWGGFGVEGLSVPVRCRQDLRPELPEITATWPGCVWIMVCLADALRVHHRGGATKLHVQMSNEWCLLTQRFFQILLRFLLLFCSVLCGEEPIMRSGWQKEARDSRVSFLRFKLTCFLWHSETGSKQ